MLADTDRRALLGLARRAVVEAVSLQRIIENIPTEGIFVEKRGVFVTLHVQGRLRGCIGVVEAVDPLGEAVARCAISAALQDPRFSPVRSEEIPQIEIEISLLSQPERIQPQDIEIGRHGLLVAQGGCRGLLLPQVAIEHKLEREAFLEETCRKAGLPPAAWKDPQTEIFGFTCEVFSDTTTPKAL